MQFPSVSKKLALASALSLFASGMAASMAQAQSADPAWFGELRQQLEVSQKCMAESITDPQETGEGAQLIQKATAMCEDGRKITAVREGTNSQFVFEIQ